MVNNNNSIEQNKKEQKNAKKGPNSAAEGNPKLNRPDNPAT
ncbi:MAG: hypothetical protein ACI35P_15865 [Bacillus sp. (in: firmicutes)]